MPGYLLRVPSHQRCMLCAASIVADGPFGGEGPNPNQFSLDTITCIEYLVSSERPNMHRRYARFTSVNVDRKPFVLKKRKFIYRRY